MSYRKAFLAVLMQRHVLLNKDAFGFKLQRNLFSCYVTFGGEGRICSWFYYVVFLGPLAKSRNASIRTRVSPSVRVKNKLGPPWKDIHEIYLSVFRKSVEKIEVLLNLQE